MEKKAILVKGTKPPSAPYSQGIAYDSLVFVSGQVSMDLKTGNPIRGTIEEETKQALENVKAILEEAGSSLANVLKVTVFLSDINNFSRMNEVYKTYFPGDKPARSTVQVKLVGDYQVEIEAIGYIPGR